MNVPMSEGLEVFRTMDEVDAVIVGAVIDLRQRVGSPFAPKKPAGVTLYAELVDARTRRTLWSGTFDADQGPPGTLGTAFGRIVSGGRPRWDSALTFARTGAHKLVASMMAHALAS